MNPDHTPKTRRRFLADLLFLGGGVTAAAILAKSFVPDDQPKPSPKAADSIQKAASAPAPVKQPDSSFDGNYVSPECDKPEAPEEAADLEKVFRDPFNPEDSPQIRGRVSTQHLKDQ
jgi:hypothetical protein